MLSTVSVYPFTCCLWSKTCMLHGIRNHLKVLLLPLTFLLILNGFVVVVVSPVFLATSNEASTSRQLVFRGHNLGEKIFRREETWHSSIFTEMKRGRWIIWQYWSTMIMSPGKNIRMGAFVLRRFYAPIHSPPWWCLLRVRPLRCYSKGNQGNLGKIGEICHHHHLRCASQVTWKNDTLENPHMSFQIFQRK